MTTRRLVLSRSAALIGAASTGLLLPQIARAQGGKFRVGLMLPYTGTFAQLGVAIENGFRMAIDEQGGKLGGREIEYFKVDDESEPSKGVENANKLVQRDKVDVLIGTVHSGVQMGIQKVARDTGVLSLIPNAGVHVPPPAACARPTCFAPASATRSPHARWARPWWPRATRRRSGSPGSTPRATRPLKASRKATPPPAAPSSRNSACPSQRRVPGAADRDRLAQARRRGLLLCRWRRGQVHPDYAAAGLKGKIPLYGSGFLTEGVLDAAGPAADGIITTMHYSDSLDTPRNKAFRLAYAKTFKHAARRVRGAGLRHRPAAGAGRQPPSRATCRTRAAVQGHGVATIDSPRGKWTMSKSHNPVQDIYLRQVENKENKVMGVAAKALADSGAAARWAEPRTPCVAQAGGNASRFFGRCLDPMDFATFLIQLLNSVQYGLLLFMLAAGLTLIFGIMGVVNLAHGSFYMLGAYLAYALSGYFGSLTLAIWAAWCWRCCLAWRWSGCCSATSTTATTWTRCC
jgi:branched-chain amino acid transport system substrate-binding protein